jgi:hypothetical protein
MADDDVTGLGADATEVDLAATTEVTVGSAVGRRRISPRGLILGVSVLAVVGAVVVVAIGLEEPGSNVVVVRSGGSDPDTSISVGFTSTVPETTVEPTLPETTGTVVGEVDTTGTGSDVQGPGPTDPPPTAQPPGPTTPPTLPPQTTTAPTVPPTTLDPGLVTTTAWFPTP